MIVIITITVCNNNNIIIIDNVIHLLFYNFYIHIYIRLQINIVYDNLDQIPINLISHSLSNNLQLIESLILYYLIYMKKKLKTFYIIYLEILL